jgi:hypothetical protein
MTKTLDEIFTIIHGTKDTDLKRSFDGPVNIIDASITDTNVGTEKD